MVTVYACNGLTAVPIQIVTTLDLAMDFCARHVVVRHGDITERVEIRDPDGNILRTVFNQKWSH